MKKAGSVVAEVLLKLKDYAAEQVSTAELNRLAEDITKQCGATALFKGVENPSGKKAFPAAICASINEQVVHGIPSGKVKLQQGDIISIDFGAKLNGYCGDAAVTLAIGKISNEKQLLIDKTKQMLDIAIENSKAGVKWSYIAGLMQKCAETAGFSVVREFVGHGIGTEMHEDPKIQNFVNDELLKNDIILKPGMVLAVEPMVNMGSSAVATLNDGWTVVARDGKPSAHFEHTIAITEKGCEVLTVV